MPIAVMGLQCQLFFLPGAVSWGALRRVPDTEFPASPLPGVWDCGVASGLTTDSPHLVEDWVIKGEIGDQPLEPAMFFLF